jgi:Tfp pilus assembly protein PilF
LQQKRLDDAERELKAVIAAADWYPEAHFYLGHLYEQRGMRDRAIQEYVKELNVNPCCTFAWARVQTWQKMSDPGK